MKCNFIAVLVERTCFLRSFIKRQTSGTSSDNEWKRVVQRVTTNDNEWYNERQRVVQQVTTNDNGQQRVTTSDKRMTTSDNEWQLVTTSDHFGWVFFQIWEGATNKHLKENSLNIEEDLWRRPTELRTEASP